MLKKIEDFGEIISGSRKELWVGRGLNVSDLNGLNPAEIKNYVNRDYIWPLPDAKKQVENGIPKLVAYWQRRVRRAVRKIPVNFEEDVLKKYVADVAAVRDLAMSIKTVEEIDSVFYPGFYKLTGRNWYSSTCCDAMEVRRIQRFRYSKAEFMNTIKSQNFPFGEKEMGEGRKLSFIPPQLSKIEREGPDYRKGKNVDEDIWQDTFLFRGVQFGNYMTQKDRQFSMNYCYDALKDLAAILMIDDKDIAFDGKLGLAFGARGKGGARAHYEPMQQVINLTKMSGAGCTAHEWMHALDHQIALAYGINDGTLASEQEDLSIFPKEFSDLVKALKYDVVGQKTDYLRGSSSFGTHFKRDSHGYWNSNCEMLARAFACYVKDCLGRKSDYLIAHADAYTFEFDNQSICAIPQGEERELFDELFDYLFIRLKKDHFFRERKREKPKTVVKSKPPKPDLKIKNGIFLFQMTEDESGQMSLTW